MRKRELHDENYSLSAAFFNEIKGIKRFFGIRLGWIVTRWVYPSFFVALGVGIIHAAFNHINPSIAELVALIPIGWFGVLFGIILISNGILIWRNRKARRSSPEPFSRWWVLGGCLIAVFVTWSSTSWMLSVAQPGQELSAVQSGLTVAAGSGGFFGLALIARKQWHGENVHLHERMIAQQQSHHEHEQRFLESYTTALQLLESEHTQTRKGGIALLEKIGETNHEWRSAIIRALCTFLQRPLGHDAQVSIEKGQPSPEWTDSKQERQLALNILINHLPKLSHSGEVIDDGWGDHPWELTGAVLPGLNLMRKKIDRPNFKDCLFTDRVEIHTSEVQGGTFEGSRFSSSFFIVASDFWGASCHKCQFEAFIVADSFMSSVDLTDCSFKGRVTVGTETKLETQVDFSRSSFSRSTEFGGALVHENGRGNIIPGWHLRYDWGRSPWRRLERNKDGE